MRNTPFARTSFSKLPTLFLFALAVIQVSSLTALAQVATPSATPTATGTPDTTVDPDPTAAPEPTAAAGILTTEGIAGDVDKKRRGPVLAVSAEYIKGDGSKGSEHVVILADTSLPNDEFKKYPVRVDFFVNRNLYTSQIRSPELPGPLGIDVPADKAKVPFNYSVIATLLYPNRSFSTVMNGAVFGSELAAEISSCTATYKSSDGTSKIYVSDAVTVTRTGENSLSVAFESDELEDGSSADSIQVAATLTVSGATASGSVVTTKNGAAATAEVTGTVSDGSSGTAGSVSSLSVASGDNGTVVACR